MGRLRLFCLIASCWIGANTVAIAQNIAQKAQITPTTHVEKCLAGQINSSQCRSLISRYWQYDRELQLAAQAYGLDPHLLRAVVVTESRYNPQALSPVGATGMMQIMPATGKGMGLSAEHLTQPQLNLLGGAYYLAQMYIEFGDWVKTIAAYNAGPGAVKKYGGIPPYRETQNYVISVLRLYTLFQTRHSKFSFATILKK